MLTSYEWLIDFWTDYFAAGAVPEYIDKAMYWLSWITMIIVIFLPLIIFFLVTGVFRAFGKRSRGRYYD